MPQPGEKRYDPVAMSLHWLTALCILTLLPLGFFMGDLPFSVKFTAYNVHKSLGLIVLALSVLRVIWRLMNPPPALPESMKPIEKMLAHAAHGLLYFLILALPLSGWIFVSATPKFPISFFGLTDAPFLPMPEGIDAKATHDMFEEGHEALAFIAVALVLLHVGAALKHHFIARDDVLARMLPKWRNNA